MRQAQLTQKRLVNCKIARYHAARRTIGRLATREASIVHWTMRDPCAHLLPPENRIHAKHRPPVPSIRARGDLGRSRQKRNDPDHFLLYAVSARTEKGA
jgi:hypothetical protein